jgi:hypothetical protein
MNLRTASILLIIAGAITLLLEIGYKLKEVLGERMASYSFDGPFSLVIWLLDLLYPLAVLFLGMALYQNSKSSAGANSQDPGNSANFN